MKRHLSLLLLSLFWSVYCINGNSATVIKALPFTITQPGAYVLGKNLTLAGAGVTAITVLASNVLIDLKGFSITLSSTNNTGTEGISVQPSSSNVTIQNGAIFNFAVQVFLTGAEPTVQNLRLEGPEGIEIDSVTSGIIQNCFIAGNVNASSPVGIDLLNCSDVVVKNNHIVMLTYGIASGSSNNWFISNYLGSCITGLALSPNDKYQGNVTTLCTTPFSGGIAVGTGNN